MSKPHRISAGGIIFKDDAVLLVRYADRQGGTFLASPGGGLEEDENVVQAIIRETMEETNVRVQPKRVAIIEDMISSRFKICKVWMICEFVEGNVYQTEGAKIEGIIEAAWFTRDQLNREVVFPTPLIQHDWDQIRSEDWQIVILPSRAVDF